MRNPALWFCSVFWAHAACAALAFLSPRCTFAQAVAPVQLSEEQSRLLDALHHNGLSSAGAAPWHLKFSFELFDELGNVQDRGTLEEFWAGARKYKRIYASNNFAETEVGTEDGIAMSGSQGPAPAGVLLLRRDFVLPLPNEGLIQNAAVAFSGTEADDGAKLQCFEVKVAPGPVLDTPRLGFDRCCIDKQTLALRSRTLSAGRQQEDEFANPQAFDGRFIPGDLRVLQQGKLKATGHLEGIEAIPAGSEADFAPPPDARFAKRGEQIPGGVIMLGQDASSGQSGASDIALLPGIAQGMLVKSVPPEYPKAAKAARVGGTVVLQALIGKDGQISDLKVVSGPALLQQAALDAVQQWVYKPYLLNGSPVKVRTTINVVFNLGGPPPAK